MTDPRGPLLPGRRPPRRSPQEGSVAPPAPEPAPPPAARPLSSPARPTSARRPAPLALPGPRLPRPRLPRPGESGDGVPGRAAPVGVPAGRAPRLPLPPPGSSPARTSSHVTGRASASRGPRSRTAGRRPARLASPGHRNPVPGAVLAAAAAAAFLFGAAAVGLVSHGSGAAASGYEYGDLGRITDGRKGVGLDGPRSPGGEPGITTTPTGNRADPVFRTENNAISTAALSLPRIPCDLPEWTGTPRGAREYFRAALPCMNTTWRSVLDRAGLPFEPPNLAFPRGSSWHSPCGAVDSAVAAAFYCSGNNTIYMPFRGLQTEQLGDQPVIYLAVLAHEYGHHVQNLAGIAEAWARRTYAGGGYDTPAGLELSRRAELQAQCFAGQFLAGTRAAGSVSRYAVANAIRNHYQRGDRPGRPRDHGSPAHYGGWMQHGFRYNNTAECNTWVSPASDVR